MTYVGPSCEERLREYAGIRQAAGCSRRPRAFDSLPFGLVEVASDGTLLRLNAALRRMLRAGADEAADGQGAEETASTVGDLCDLGWSVVWCDGNRASDPRTAFLLVVSDVTAEVRAQQALAERERRLRLAFNASPDGWAVFAVTPGGDGQPILVREALLNDQACRLTGQAEEDVAGLEIGQVLGWSSGEWIREQAAAALKFGQAPPTRTPVQVKDQWRLVETATVRLDDAILFCSWRDVTDLVDAERRLNRAYEETAEMRVTLQTALDATSEGFAIYQLEWDDAMRLAALRVVHANAAGAEFLGLEPDAMVGMELHELFPEAADERPVGPDRPRGGHQGAPAPSRTRV